MFSSVLIGFRFIVNVDHTQHIRTIQNRGRRLIYQNYSIYITKGNINKLFAIINKQK